MVIEYIAYIYIYIYIYNEPLIDVDSDNRLSIAVICLFVWVFYQFLVVCVPLIISIFFLAFVSCRSPTLGGR